MGEIRFTTSADGTRIAYTTFGHGPPLVEVPRWAQTIEWNSRDEEFARFYQKLGEFRRVTIVERRGTGASQREVSNLSMEAHVQDVRAVADHLGLGQFDLLGSGDASAVCVRFAAEMPARVRKMVLWGAYAEGFSRAWSPLALLASESPENRREMFRANFPLAARLISDSFFPNQPAEEARRTAALWVESVPPDVAYQYFLFVQTLNVSAFLEQVRAPTLVLHRRNDRTGHLIEYGRQVAAEIPDARFVVVDGEVGVHQYEHEPIMAEMSSFLGGDRAEVSGPASPVAFRTVLFTDLVGHTEMMSRLGDERGREVLREHERITLEVLKSNGGTEVKTMGDGFMASFGSVTKAVECAIALQRAFASHDGEPLAIRVGLNAGEPIEEDGDLFGATVILASRIAAKAEGGEILVADTVRGLCSGKGFLFADRGDFVAKGFEERVRVYAVSWRQ